MGNKRFSRRALWWCEKCTLGFWTLVAGIIIMLWHRTLTSLRFALPQKWIPQSNWIHVQAKTASLYHHWPLRNEKNSIIKYYKLMVSRFKSQRQQSSYSNYSLVKDNLWENFPNNLGFRSWIWIWKQQCSIENCKTGRFKKLDWHGQIFIAWKAKHYPRFIVPMCFHRNVSTVLSCSRTSMSENLNWTLQSFNFTCTTVCTVGCIIFLRLKS